LERENSEYGEWLQGSVPLTNANVIRALVLDPSEDFEGGLKGEFQHIPLPSINDENGYIALSYACGDVGQTQD
jgi:hypothetical protein